TEKTVLNWLCYWIFTDRPLGGKERARMSLNVRYIEGKPLLDYGIHPSGTLLEYNGEPAFGEWRLLVLEVTPTEVSVFWEGDKKDTINWAKIDEQLRTLRDVTRMEMEALGFASNYPDPSFNSRGGLGFYVDACTASFRNVTIAPLVGKK